ncbi:hypothetical protein BCR34DRAFT_142156 [Clohesyomyces aquaticus]|uniref:Protein kinase domain-containing protein n=1 Tax=Clohesyomyces aquaticus TaxID=1231657 RepID=A0A1Y1YMZ7_9PLEO|nr:hypothetical protein BCR34DRAFT_142156 [Clohesyomyces aquaticus]
MGDSTQEQRSFRNVLDEFKIRLKEEWTRSVSCQRQCKARLPPTACDCKLYIVNVEKLEAWMRRQDSEDTPNTNAGRLVTDLHEKMSHRSAFGLPIDHRPILQRCTLVFSILLALDRGDLIDLFHNAGIYDTYLDLPEHNHGRLRATLRLYHIRESEIDEVVQAFENEKWAYCAPLSHFSLGMDEAFGGGRMIMPFCRRIRVNEKGGTASVSWVAIQEDLISDDKLRDALKKSLHKDEEFGWCFQMALKSYSENRKDLFTWEKESFSAFRNDPDMPIVRYLGCYIHEDGKIPTLETTYNLLLEFGESDLDEYFADVTNIAPVLAPEIILFWESLFKVAVAINKIHNLQIMQGNKVMEYHGWHADIKPDNILQVHGEFKIADFGFSRFSENNGKGEVPKQYIEGGTDTYGAPEFARMKISGTRSEVTQSIDTWSFGCVLSVAATWIVLGFQGIRQYKKLRKTVKGTKTPDGSTTDRFHDGNDVLPEIKRWHNFLRGHLRVADTATPLVLDLIEGHMLQKDPLDRYKFPVLCNELAKVCIKARANLKDLPVYARDMDPAVKHALLEMEEAEESRASSVEITPLTLSVEKGTWHVSADPLQRATRGYHEEIILRHVPLPEMPYRQELLTQDLNATFISGNSFQLDRKEVSSVVESPTLVGEAVPQSPSTLKQERSRRHDGPTFGIPAPYERNSPIPAQPQSQSLSYSKDISSSRYVQEDKAQQQRDYKIRHKSLEPLSEREESQHRRNTRGELGINHSPSAPLSSLVKRNDSRLLANLGVSRSCLNESYRRSELYKNVDHERRRSLSTEVGPSHKSETGIATYQPSNVQELVKLENVKKFRAPRPLSPVEPAVASTSATHAITLSLVARDCDQLLSNILEAGHTPGYKNTLATVEDSRGRLRVWAAGLGCYRDLNDRDSLDYRVRNQREVRDAIGQELSKIVEWATKANRIVNGTVPNRTFVSLSSTFEATQNNELDQLNRGIEAAISVLMRLSTAVRQAATTAESTGTSLRNGQSVIDIWPKLKDRPWLAQRIDGMVADREEKMLRFQTLPTKNPITKTMPIAEVTAAGTNSIKGLKTYVCTFEDCSPALFTSFDKWFRHEMTKHRRDWFCLACKGQEFSTKTTMAAHLTSVHRVDRKTQLAPVIESCHLPKRHLEAGSCPLCDSWIPASRDENNVDEFYRHLLHHFDTELPQTS